MNAELISTLATALLSALALRKFVHKFAGEQWTCKHWRTISLLGFLFFGALMLSCALLQARSPMTISILRSVFGAGWIFLIIVPCTVSIVRNNPILYIPRGALFCIAGGSCILRALTELSALKLSAGG